MKRMNVHKSLICETYHPTMKKTDILRLACRCKNCAKAAKAANFWLLRADPLRCRRGGYLWWLKEILTEQKVRRGISWESKTCLGTTKQNRLQKSTFSSMWGMLMQIPHFLRKRRYVGNLYNATLTGQKGEWLYGDTFYPITNRRICRKEIC